MKTFATTTAFLVLTAGTALAQVAAPATPATDAPATAVVTTAPATTGMTMGTSAMQDGLFRAEDIEDRNIYTLSRDGTVRWNDDTVYSNIDTNWENIGEIEDVVLNQDGQMVGLVADVGGWLGIGAKEVLIPLNELRPVLQDGEISYVTQMSEEQLKSFPAVEDSYWGN